MIKLEETPAMLYPLKFEPIYKERVWGGSKLREHYNRLSPADKPIGESWEISGIAGDVSVVSNGYLAGNNIQELIEVYMGELVGDHVYNRYGEEFPILVKLLDTQDLLSIQVHPENKLSIERHNAYGKTEMWYVMENDPDACIYLGFNRSVSEKQYLEHLEGDRMAELLNKEAPKKGEVYFVPPGTIHSIGGGLLLAEIQQTSDVTYRIYDWNRKDQHGQLRELHTELAMDALDFSKADHLRIDYQSGKNRAEQVLECPHFITRIIDLEGRVERDYSDLDSFVIYLCLEGEAIVECDGGAESMMDAETVLLPAEFEYATLSGNGKILEIFMPK